LWSTGGVLKYGLHQQDNNSTSIGDVDIDLHYIDLNSNVHGLDVNKNTNIHARYCNCRKVKLQRQICTTTMMDILMAVEITTSSDSSEENRPDHCWALVAILLR
jgi:hypothetical protein